MNLDEAKKIADICCTADGGCGTCAGALTRRLQAAFPEFRWVYDESAEWIKLPDPEYADNEWCPTYCPIQVTVDK